MAVPTETPVTTPVVEFTVARAGFKELQLPPAAVEANVVVNPVQIFWFPLKVPAFGAAVTVTVRGVDATAAQPPVPGTV